jgi:cystathionine beta-lyase/cystathionine gamma-synthase
MNTEGYQFATLAVHAGVEPDPTTGAIMTPIYQTSTYVQDGPGGHKGYEYARTQNPTRDALQTALAALERAKYSSCFASGLASIDAVLKLLAPGDEVIASNDLYGGTYRLMRRVFEPFGLKFHFVDMTDIANVTRVLTPRTRLLWIETPTNPLLRIVDIAALVSAVKGKGVLTAVDNTFASPALQTPLDLGADLVMHSVTKYLGGHSDVVMGALCYSDATLHERIRFLQNAVGAVPGPQDCFLVLRGLKTLHLRVERSGQNAERIARWLVQHPKVEYALWPGFESHPGHALAKKQMRGFGGMISFGTTGDRLADAETVLRSTRIFACAESLGGVESLIGHPASMTHASIPVAERHAAGLKDALIRLSVGIEDAGDLIGDLDQALAKV